MTGIIDIRDHLIEQSGAILEIQDGNIGKIWTQTGEINLRKFTLLNNILYLNNSGSLIPKDRTKETITTRLENIYHVSKLTDDLVFIGSR